jgi:transposase
MEEYAALIAIDWADKQHAVSLLDVGSGKREQLLLKHTPATLQEWALSLRTRFGGKLIAVALEQARGPLIYALLQYDFLVLYPINPATLAKYRQAFSTALGKDDPTDADYLLDLLEHHRGRLRAWRPDDEKTRTLRFLVEHRRRLSNDQTPPEQSPDSAAEGLFPSGFGLVSRSPHFVGLRLSRALADPGGAAESPPGYAVEVLAGPSFSARRY